MISDILALINLVGLHVLGGVALLLVQVRDQVLHYFITDSCLIDYWFQDMFSLSTLQLNSSLCKDLKIYLLSVSIKTLLTAESE